MITIYMGGSQISSGGKSLSKHFTHNMQSERIYVNKIEFAVIAISIKTQTHSEAVTNVKEIVKTLILDEHGFYFIVSF